MDVMFVSVDYWIYNSIWSEANEVRKIKFVSEYIIGCRNIVPFVFLDVRSVCRFNECIYLFLVGFRFDSRVM